MQNYPALINILNGRLIKGNYLTTSVDQGEDPECDISSLSIMFGIVCTDKKIFMLRIFHVLVIVVVQKIFQKYHQCQTVWVQIRPVPTTHFG